VATGQRVRQRRGLDRRGGLDAETGEDGAEACGHAKGGEGGQVESLSVRVSHQQPNLEGDEATTHGADVRLRRADQLAVRSRRADGTILADALTPPESR